MISRKLSDVISENSAKHAKSYAACFKADCEGRFYHAGTLTGIDLGHRTVLVTAKHVFDRDERNPCDEGNVLYAYVNGRIEQLDKFRTAILPLPDESFLDILVFVPETHEPREIIKEPIPSVSSMLFPPEENHYLAACGFPLTKNRRKGKELSNRPYGYFGTGGTSLATRTAGYDPKFHFSIRVNLKKTFRDGLKEVIAPNPEGISGGPVFAVHDFNRSTQFDTLFAGIVIARDKTSKLLICVQAGTIIEVAHELFGERLAT